MVSVLAVSVTFTDRDYALIQVIQDGFSKLEKRTQGPKLGL